VLTPAGRKLLETLRGRMETYEQRLAGGLSAAERKVLMGLLGRVVG
jgi:DNA-binding MarR family transcriptional regulator